MFHVGFEMGDIVEIGGIKFRVLYVDYAKKEVKLKIIVPEF